jgi:hypothetical protein
MHLRSSGPSHFALPADLEGSSTLLHFSPFGPPSRASNSFGIWLTPDGSTSRRKNDRSFRAKNQGRDQPKPAVWLFDYRGTVVGMYIRYLRPKIV